MKYFPVIAIALLYISIQLMGLYIGSDLIPRIESNEIPPAIEEPENPISSLIIFFYILFGTAILLLILKFKLDFVIRILFILIMSIGLLLTLSVLLGEVGILLAAILLILSILRSRNPAVMNMALLFTVPGIGAFLGSSLAFIPALLLIIMLSAYDLVAVFGTKHMITLAEGAKGKIPLMFLIPFEGRSLGLGTGDLAIPLIFTVSVLRDYSLNNAIITAAGGLIGIVLLFLYILNKKEVALPALPPICAGLVAGFGVSFLI